MSFDESTGWAKLTARQVASYCRVIPAHRAAIEERLNGAGIDWYWDGYGGLHLHCTHNEAWELLSGQPSSWEEDEPIEPTETEWIRVTDLCAVFEPPVGASTILRLLREEGFLERVDGKDRPTAAAAEMCLERPATPSVKFNYKPGTVQRLWSYEVVVRLRAHADAMAAARKEEHDELHPKRTFTFKLRFPAICTECHATLAPGDLVSWRSSDGAFRCALHLTTQASQQEVPA